LLRKGQNSVPACAFTPEAKEFLVARSVASILRFQAKAFTRRTLSEEVFERAKARLSPVCHVSLMNWTTPIF
jgi:hypothetical protein